ncbi:putative immune-type receptor 7 precursor, partial [Clarias magur]
KPSEFQQLHIKTVKHEQDVTMECNISEVKNKNTLSWYRQSFGKLPQLIARQYGQNNYIFVEGFNNSRFSVTLKDQKFDLTIKNLREDDGGEYFCGEVDENSLKFTSGTSLQFEGEEKKLCPTPGTLNKNTHSVTHQGSNSRDGEGKTSDIKNLHVKTVKFGDDVIMQCNINGLKNKNSLAWYRQSFEKVPQVFSRPFGQSSTFADGFNDSRFSVTVNDYKFNLNINETRKDDGGEYFCGYVEGSTVKFTSGTHLQFEGEEMKLCPTPGTLNTHSVTHQGSNSSDRE